MRFATKMCGAGRTWRRSNNFVIVYLRHHNKLYPKAPDPARERVVDVLARRLCFLAGAR